jgi:P4 family phage/plasmid primase-like protien
MDFQEISILANQGVIFVGTSLGKTRSDWNEWQHKGTDSISKLKEWVDGGYGLVAVAAHGHQFMIDKDDPAACKAMGMPEPFLTETYAVDTPSGGEHQYGHHDEVTETLGNLVVVYAEPGNPKSKKILELKLNGANSVAAPTTLRSGQPGKCDGVYKPRDQKKLAKGLNPEFVEWLRKYGTFVGAPKGKGAAGPARKFHPDFELDEHLEHHEAGEAFSYNKDGALHVVSNTCPLNGGPHRSGDEKQHVRDRVTEFIYGRNGWGFSCVVCNVFTKAEFEQKMLELDPEWEPYPYFVYEDEDDELVLKAFDAEPVSDDIPESENTHAVSPDEITKEVTSLAQGYTYSLDDTGNGERLVRRYGRLIRHVYETGEWMVWSSGGWEQDANGKLMRMTKSVIGELVDQAGDDKARWIHAKKSASVPGRKAMIASASVEKGIITNISEWDRDGWLFNCQNGVIELKTQTFRKRTQEDLCTKQSPITVDQNATCPLWEAAMDKWCCRDKELVEYLQTAWGVTLTSDTSLQALFFCQGGGENGKDTAFSVIEYIMGTYWRNVNFMTFAETKNHSEHRNDLADLAGAVRMVTSCESSDGHSLDEGVIKQVTGCSPVTCRQIMGKPFTYVPQYKMWFMSNYEPVVKGSDRGIWRRLKKIPWNYTIKPEEKDPHFTEKLLAEAPGILNWMLKGLRRYIDLGHKLPYCEAVEKSTNQYMEDMDLVSRFVKDRMFAQEEATALGCMIYRSYVSWCKENGFFALNSRRFYAEFRKRCPQFQETAGKSGAVFHGVGLLIDGNHMTPEEIQ